MSLTGHCNCGAITVSIPSKPEGSILCYCSNCQRASAGMCSTNYLLDTTSVHIEDPNSNLKSYKDSNTKSGNTITRQFCGVCGCPVATLLANDSPKIIVKAGLFDFPVPPPVIEAFTEGRPEWLNTGSS